METLIINNQFTLREPKVSDVKGINELLNSIVKENKHWSITKIMTIKQRKMWFNEYLKNRKDDKSIMFVIVKDDEVVASGSANREPDRRNHIWEIGYQVRKDYRNIGLCSLLIERLLKYLKNQKAESLIAWVLSSNKTSINLLKKFKFNVVGKIKRGVKFSNKYYDYLLFQKVL